MKHTATRHGRTARATLGFAFGLIVLLGAYGSAARADDKKDWWCGVIQKQIDRNTEESRKAHDSAGAERLREERRRLDKDAADHHCSGM